MSSSARRAALASLSLALSASVLLTLSACTSSAAPKAKGLSVVTSTDVYADIVRQIAGPEATVTSFISDPSQDPHSYEADTRNQLALSRADIVIENGGGYDDFMDTLLRASGNHHAAVLNAVKISGRTAPPGGDLNEHVWYDFGAVVKLVERLVGALTVAAPGHAGVFTARSRTFLAGLQQLMNRETSIGKAHAGEAVAITEPVPLYLLQACGLVNKTPPAFSASIQNGTDTPAAVLQQTLELFTGKQVRALVYNEQTSGPQTSQILAAARSNGIPIVAVTETLPSGKNFLTWMQSNLDAVSKALTK
jgi:zinc/manganese transport system substrate-binding protein